MRAIARLKPLLAVFPLAFAVMSCDGTPAQGVTCDTDLGQTEAGRKVGLFIDTSDALVKAANQIDADMQSVCLGMAADLGIPSSELEPPLGQGNAAGARTKAACTRVKAEIDDIIKTDVPVAARLSITYTPAVCTIDAELKTQCIRECRPKTVTVTELECEPGHFYGQCSATCSGTCGGSCSGMCQGQCTATCNGTCSGHCNGTCTGTCSAKNADGSCYGTCTGTCMGSCDATCTGSCSGSCNGSCSAKCTGGCEGDCSVWVQPPQCTEVKKEVTVDECETTCDSQARFAAVCTEPQLTVTYGVTASTARVAKLVTAVKNHYGLLLKVGARTGTAIGDSVSGFSTALSGVGTYAEQVGAQAALCVVDAVSAVSAAATQINVSASFSLSVSASVTAEGSATAK
jgi:modification target Cys-rich repeat protein